MPEVFGREMSGGEEAAYQLLGGSLFLGGTQNRIDSGGGPYQVQRGVAELGQRWDPHRGRYVGQDEDYRNILMGSGRAAAHRAAAAERGAGLMASGPDTAAADQARQQQLAAIRNLQAVGTGQQRSAAENAMRDATDRQMATARSLAMSQAGMSPAARLRAAQGAASDIGAQGARQASQIAAQQQQMAQQGAVQALAGLRGQDAARMGQQQALNLANLQANLQQAQAGRQQQMQAQGMAMGMDQATAGRRVQLEQAQAQAQEAQAQRALQAQMSNQQAQANRGGIFNLFG